MALPAAAQAVFEALDFTKPRFDLLKQLDDYQWRTLLSFCDRTHLTLPFALRRPNHRPAWVIDRLEQNLLDNAQRWQRIKAEYRRISAALREEGIELITLKGFSHAPAFVARPSLRPQYDFDFLFDPRQIRRALEIALRLGYVPVANGDGHPLDHLPTMIRKTKWQWQGDYFDPEHPLALELHFRLWDLKTEGFAVPGLGEFWHRRERRSVEGVEFTSLAAVDLPGYASAHALRHLLRGDLRPAHIYEIGSFLERNRDPDFWRSWRDCHDEPLRRVQAICFALAYNWFGCRLPVITEEEIQQLPRPVRTWLDTYTHSPAALFQAAKTELWLHLGLLDPGRSRLQILRRRLLPLQIPNRAGAAQLSDGRWNWRVRLRDMGCYLRWLMRRLAHHMRAFVPTLWSGALWFLRANQ